MKSREIWKKQHKNLYRFFSWKSLRRFFFMCFRIKTFQENEHIFFFFFLFKELRRHYIFMCETKWKETIRIVFGVFFWKTFQENFLSFGKNVKGFQKKSFHIFPCETELKKKKVFLFLEENLWGNFIMQNYF